MFPDFPVDPTDPGPGAQHRSISDAMADADADGTRSILDIDSVADSHDFGTAAPLDDDTLQDLFETTRPTHEMVEDNMDFFDSLDRGQAIYIIIYKNDHPHEIFFAGYFYD